MPLETPQTSVIPKSHLRYDRSSWPRDTLDEGRVAMFSALLLEGETLPTIEVVPRPDGTYLICDGVHRSFAAIRTGRTEIEAVIVVPQGGESPADCAYRRALETATRSALPLTRNERRRAALRLVASRPDMSRRAIARVVGVAHSTVDRWVGEATDSASAEKGDPPSGADTATAEQMARRLVSFLARLEDSRGLLDYLSTKRMGRHFAQAFSERFEDSALDEARRFRSWMDLAVTSLESDAS